MLKGVAGMRLRESALEILNRIRVRSGDLNIGFHHHRLGWTKSIERVVSDSDSLTVSLKDAIQPERTHTHVFQERSIWEIRDAVVMVRSGLVLVNGNAVRDSVRSHTAKRSRKLAPRRIMSRARFRETIIFSAHNPRNYYHWLLEDLPALLRAKKHAPDAAVVLGGRQPGYVAATLGIAGAGPIKHAFQNIDADRLILAGQGDDTGWPHPDDIALIRQHLMPADRADTHINRSIYLSRPPGRRSYTNENEICEFMAQHGIEIVSPEKLSFDEQVELFASSNTVIGAHGAALTNIVFCSPGTRVLELALPSRAIQTFECLAYFCRLDYSRVLIPTLGLGEVATVQQKQLDQISQWLGAERS